VNAAARAVERSQRERMALGIDAAQRYARQLEIDGMFTCEVAARGKAGDSTYNRRACCILSKSTGASRRFGHPGLQRNSFYTERAIAMPQPNDSDSRTDRADAYTQQAMARHREGDLDGAATLYAAALAEDPDAFEPAHMLGVVRLQEGHVDEAITRIRAALQQRPDSVDALCDLGGALVHAGQMDEAVGCYERALAERPDRADILYDLGNAEYALGRHDRAFAAYDRAVALAPQNPVYLHNRGVARFARGNFDGAIGDFDAALAVTPENAGIYVARGHAYAALWRHEEAAANYRAAFALDPWIPYLPGHLAFRQLMACDWTEFDASVKAIVAGVRAGQAVCFPLVILGLTDDPADQLECARAYINAQVPAVAPPPRRQRAPRDRLRIAYLSANYNEHAVAVLISELFERHDRARFELYGVSFGTDDRSGMRARIEAAFDTFVDVRSRTDADVAQVLREADIDIAVDLMGHTTEGRPGILARRPAPVQVNYLGHPGTMGADYVDYIVADRFIIPPGEERHYTERVVRLPDCYQPNDTKRRVDERVPSRAELGLPERGFVFCCFNNSFKLNPPVFDAWMRLLRAVEGSVLWLLGVNDAMERNLRSEAERRGVPGERLVFARMAPHPRHLARHRAADLLLDTLPYNAHTTGSDALWAGLPVLTCVGQSFAARVGESLLNAVGLPELVTRNLADYETLALALARDPARLRALRERLACNRPTAPLFDIDRFRRHIEAAYMTMWDIHRRGEPPRAFDVAALD
jgi:predicted O-linked N-acetylglucosamine transferase (SPINDLY family)